MNFDITQIIAPATILGNVAILALILFIFIIRKKNTNNTWYQWLKKHGLIFALAISLIATFSSLYYSEILNFVPCKLCWIQRIFMYPQVILLAIAVWFHDLKIKMYLIPLCILGSATATYHYLTQRFPEVFPISCSSTEVSCAFTYGFDFGYITIPMMSLTAFILLIIFLSIASHPSTGTAQPHVTEKL